MNAWDKLPEPMPGPWAEDPRNPYLTNLRHPLIHAEYLRYKQERGFPLAYPISDGQRLAFDLRMVKRYGRQYLLPERVRFRYHEIAEWLQKKRDA